MERRLRREKNRKKTEKRVGTRTSPGLNGQERKIGKEERKGRDRKKMVRRNG